MIADSAVVLIQAAESVAAVVDSSPWATRVICALLTMACASTLWTLRGRLRYALGRRSRVVRWMLPLPGLCLLPTAAMAVAGPEAGRALREVIPSPLTLACMAAQFALVVYGCVLVLENAWRLARRRLQPRRGLENPSRRVVLRSALVGVPAMIAGASGAGTMLSQQRPVVTRLGLALRPDFRALSGLRIVQFSDVHIGSFVDGGRLTQLADAINACRPDVVVCTGDLVDDRIEQLQQAQDVLRALRARIGTFLCMGNHEYFVGDEAAVLGGMRQAGVTVLRDGAIRLPVRGSHLWLGGTDFPDSPGGTLGERTPVEASLAAVMRDMRDDGAPRIVLSHHPKTFFAARELPIDLMLSGHTHGGQIHVARVGDYALGPLLPFEFYHKGLYEHAGRRLYVNSGIGSWLPVRLNCPPELTLVELV